MTEPFFLNRTEITRVIYRQYQAASPRGRIQERPPRSQIMTLGLLTALKGPTCAFSCKKSAYFNENARPAIAVPALVI